MKDNEKSKAGLMKNAAFMTPFYPHRIIIII